MLQHREWKEACWWGELQRDVIATGWLPCTPTAEVRSEKETPHTFFFVAHCLLDTWEKKEAQSVQSIGAGRVQEHLSQQNSLYISGHMPLASDPSEVSIVNSNQATKPRGRLMDHRGARGFGCLSFSPARNASMRRVSSQHRPAPLSHSK